jgi:hypothetical protein
VPSSLKPGGNFPVITLNVIPAEFSTGKGMFVISLSFIAVKLYPDGCVHTDSAISAPFTVFNQKTV